MFKNISLLTISMLIYGCNSGEEAQAALDDAELIELHELKPISGDDITQEEYEAALDLVDNESEDSRFQYSTDESEIAMLQKRNAELNSKSGEPYDKMIADFGGFSDYAGFLESHSHDCDYLKNVHQEYGLRYDDFSEGNTCVREAPKHPTFYAPGEPRPMRELQEYVGLPIRDAVHKALKEYTNLQYVGVNTQTHPVTGDCDTGMFRYWVLEPPADDVVADARVDDC